MLGETPLYNPLHNPSSFKIDLNALTVPPITGLFSECRAESTRKEDLS